MTIFVPSSLSHVPQWDLTISILVQVADIKVCQLSTACEKQDDALVGDSGGSTVKLPSSIRARSHHECTVPECGVCMLDSLPFCCTAPTATRPGQCAASETSKMILTGGMHAGCRHIADNGEMVRPWCPATRLLDHREAEALNAKAEAAKKAGMTDSRFSESTVPLRNDFPALEVSSAIPPAQAQTMLLKAAGVVCSSGHAGALPASLRT